LVCEILSCDMSNAYLPTGCIDGTNTCQQHANASNICLRCILYRQASTDQEQLGLPVTIHSLWRLYTTQPQRTNMHRVRAEKMLCGIYRHQEEDMHDGRRRKQRNNQVHNLYSSQNILRTIKFGRCVGHASYTEGHEKCIRSFSCKSSEDESCEN
jgi:hypothetical protein